MRVRSNVTLISDSDPSGTSALEDDSREGHSHKNSRDVDFSSDEDRSARLRERIFIRDRADIAINLTYCAKDTSESSRSRFFDRRRTEREGERSVFTYVTDPES